MAEHEHETSGLQEQRPEGEDWLNLQAPCRGGSLQRCLSLVVVARIMYGHPRPRREISIRFRYQYHERSPCRRRAGSAWTPPAAADAAVVSPMDTATATPCSRVVVAWLAGRLQLKLTGGRVIARSLARTLPMPISVARARVACPLLRFASSRSRRRRRPAS